MTTTKTKLEPGTYRLTRDVTNPRPDRRQRHDWRALPAWKAGTEFCVKDALLPSEANTPQYELWTGPWQHMCFASWNANWELIAPHLERVDERPSDFIWREHGPHSNAAVNALDVLYSEGALSLDQIKDAIKRYYERIETEERGEKS